jgi:aspartate carbamoyltransferase catalytic subunit
VSSELRHLAEVTDLTPAEVDHVLRRTEELAAGADPAARGAVVGLLFLTPSLRTRAGFAVAAHRLGCHVVEASSQRDAKGTTNPESVPHTVRTFAGMVDLLIVRLPRPLDAGTTAAMAATPSVNAGDGDRGHPTQALVDLAAIEAERGPLGDQVVAICGDLTTRSARSLLRLFAVRPPAALVLMAPPWRQDHGVDLGATLLGRTDHRQPDELSGIDVLVQVGLAPSTGSDHLADDQRSPYRLDEGRLRALPKDAVVLSPLPVIDEIDEAALQDSRIGVWRQSDRGVLVRTAILELVLDPTTTGA